MANVSAERAQTPFVTCSLTSIPEGPPETPARAKGNLGTSFPTTPQSKYCLESAFSAVTSAQSTPYMLRNIQTAAGGKMVVKEQQTVVREELRTKTVVAEKPFVAEVFQQRSVFPTLTAIRNYLNKSNLFDTKSQRWHEVPEEPKAERELYEPFGRIFDDIIKSFGLDSEKLGSRVPHLCVSRKLAHSESEDTTNQSSPDFVITGFDEHFPQMLKEEDEPEYASAVSCLEAKLDKYLTPLVDHHAQVGVYARQIFNTQPNRNFVRSAVFSKRHMSLLHFYRSGLKHTDTHDDAADFVRIVLGLSYPAPKVIGFDDTITFEWIVKENGEEERCGFLHTYHANGKWKKSKIKGLVPCFQGRGLTGRGATCWDIIVDEHGDEVAYLVKESSRTESRPSEKTFLEIAKGLEGRVKCETLPEKYGGPVHEFQTELQLFCAFKDAIRGHRGLLHRNILHRDVSLNNILVGKHNATEGWRGVRIDLDMAIMIDRDPDSIAAGIRTGTRIFQSVNILKTVARPRSF